MIGNGLARVTIITPVFNGQKFIKSFFDGLLLQKCSFRVIVINDASSDDTKDLLLEYQMKLPFAVDIITEATNMGPGAARFKAIGLVGTEFIAFCDIDDVWPENKLLLQLDEMENSDANWSYHGRHIFLNGESTGEFIDVSPIATMFDVLTTRYIGLSSVVIRTSTASQLPSLEGEYLGEDYIWWANLMAITGPPLAIQGLFYDYHIHGGSSSKNKLKMAGAVFDIYVIRNVIPVARSFGFLAFMGYALKSIVRMIVKKNASS